MFQYHTFSHHSQTCRNVLYRLKSFSTIRFYIILKPDCRWSDRNVCFSTIRFYIILKLPHVIPLMDLVSVPYVFTSFSNLCVRITVIPQFQYHTFLHHSQTTSSVCQIVTPFQYHTFLHHSQTSNSKMNRHHLRKTRYSNTFNRFHIDLYL